MTARRLPSEAWRDVLVAIDVGTSGARAAAFDLDGVRRLEARRPYPTESPRPGWAEQDPGAWRSASVSALADLVRRLGPRRRVLAIGLTGQCPTVCLVDARGRPTGPGLIYRDNRAGNEAAWIRERFGDERLHQLTGHLATAFHIAPKLLWIRRHDPAWFDVSALALQPRDLVVQALTGEAVTDGTHAAATLAYNVRAGSWDDELLDGLELPASIFPRLAACSLIVGTLRDAVASRVGLPASTPIVLGGADSQACALGAGVVDPGPVSEMAGSSTCLNAAVPEPLSDLRVTHYPHVIPGRFTTETGINTTGTAIGWVADWLYGRRRSGAASRAAAADYERLDAEAAAVPPGSEGVQALPVLGDGERTDPRLRGAFTGLSLRHGRAHMARAMLEGVAYVIRQHLEVLEAAGAPVRELRVSGGDARLRTWNQVKADVIGRPVVTIPGDAAVGGVAMLAGLGSGVYASVADAIARCVREEERYLPDPEAAATYDAGYEDFSALYGSGVVRASAER